jgi:RimJ/RimL family protein N-acetyltransferase
VKIDFVPMDLVPVERYIELNTHPEVRRLMPLASDSMTYEVAEVWRAGKCAQWQENGYGPWAILVDAQFAGWGGLQKHHEDADLGIVLHPDHWGIGPVVAKRMIEFAFATLSVPSLIVLLPPERKRVRALVRWGFVREGEEEIGGNRFVRYRLARPAP